MNISWIKLPEKDYCEFPILRPTDFVSYLSRSGNLGKLVGGISEDIMELTLLTFWKRYAVEFPDHQVYGACERGELSLSKCIPVMVHGDEGRSLKRSGILLISIQGAIGKGARPFIRRHKILTLRQARMGVNIGGSSYNSRLLFAAMQKKHYTNNPDAWQRLFNCAWFLFVY